MDRCRWIELGGRPKWLPSNYVFSDVMASMGTSPIHSMKFNLCLLLSVSRADWSSACISPACQNEYENSTNYPKCTSTSLSNGACAHYVMVSKFQWKPFWLATQRDPQNDWTATQKRVNYDVFAQAPFVLVTQSTSIPKQNPQTIAPRMTHKKRNWAGTEKLVTLESWLPG